MPTLFYAIFIKTSRGVITINIEFVGNTYTNKSSRNNHKPLVIVNHISEGGEQSVLSWGTSKNNNVSSWHFFVTRKGKIYQFLPIEQMAWANGLTANRLQNATAKIVHQQNINPNLYSVSIEHEGFYNQTHGSLTEVQFQATVWLHKYIQSYVQKVYNHTISFDRNHIIGHFEIDPIRKPNCPGELFPWDKLITALNGQQIEVIKKVELQNGSNIPVFKYNNKDVVELSKVIGYLPIKQITTHQTIYKVNTDVLNVRDNKMGEIIGQVKLNDKVEKIGVHQDGDWVKIKFNSLIGYVNAKYLVKYTDTNVSNNNNNNNDNYGYKKIRRYNTDIHVYTVNPKQEDITIDLGKRYKHELLPNIIKQFKKGQVTCATNCGFFEFGNNKIEHYGTLVIDGLYYSPSGSSFIDFIYWKDGTTEIVLNTSYGKHLNTYQSKANFAIGTSYSLMQKGKINLQNAEKYDHAKYCHPRTFFGQRKDGVFIVLVADGRTKWDKGLTAIQQANICKELDLYNAVNLDGGGSSIMMINDKVVSGNYKANRPIGSALIVYKK